MYPKPFELGALVVEGIHTKSVDKSLWSPDFQNFVTRFTNGIYCANETLRFTFNCQPNGVFIWGGSNQLIVLATPVLEFGFQFVIGWKTRSVSRCTVINKQIKFVSSWKCFAITGHKLFFQNINLFFRINIAIYFTKSTNAMILNVPLNYNTEFPTTSKGNTVQLPIFVTSSYRPI